MLELPNYGLMTISTILFKKSRVTNFAGIIKIATMFIKTTFKDSNKVKRIRN